MVELIIQFQWELFIVAETLSWICLLLFGFIRYFQNNRSLSTYFIVLFVLFIFIEAILALVVYRETGEISNFQIIITIFVLYACTFGITDFKKLDRWMRKKIGGWRGVNLLSDKDIQIMNRQKDPKYIAKKYRWSSCIHLILFVAVQIGFLVYSQNSLEQIIPYVKDLSWIGTEDVGETPYANDTLYGISMVWGIVFIVDFIWSWSYTIFPAKPKS